MNWVRCAMCRTLGDVERFPRCMMCGTALSTARPAVAIAPPRVEVETGRDLELSKFILVLVPLCCAAGLFLMLGGVRELMGGGGTTMLAFIGVGILLSIVFGFLGFKGVERMDVGPTGKVILRFVAALSAVVLSVVAIVLGLLVLLFVVCVSAFTGHG